MYSQLLSPVLFFSYIGDHPYFFGTHSVLSPNFSHLNFLFVFTYILKAEWQRQTGVIFHILVESSNAPNQHG